MGNSASVSNTPLRQVHVSYPIIQEQDNPIINTLINKLLQYSKYIHITCTEKTVNQNVLQTCELMIIILSYNSATDYSHIYEINYGTKKLKNILFLLEEPNSFKNYQNLLSNKSWMYCTNINDIVDVENYLKNTFCAMEH